MVARHAVGITAAWLVYARGRQRRPSSSWNAVAVGWSLGVAAPAEQVSRAFSGLRSWWTQIQVSRARHRPPMHDAEAENDHVSAQHVTYLAAWVNVSLAFLKLGAGLLCSSAALVADAGHSFSDLISDGVTLWAVRMAQIPPDKDHPYGHGRFEAVGALGVSILVLAAGFGIGVEAWQLLVAVILNTGTAIPQTPGLAALLACIASIASKEYLFRLTDEVGRRLNSPVIRANAAHHRSDAYSSAVAIVGVAGARFGMRALDPVAALVVAGMVFKMGVNIAADALGQLTDTTDRGIVTAVERAARGVPGVAAVFRARARAAGSHWLVEVDVMPGQFVTSLSAADHLAACVQHTVLNKVKDAVECLVRVRTSTLPCPTCTLDVSPTPQEIDASVRGCLQAVPGVKAVSRTMTHFSASFPSVEVWIEVASDRSVEHCSHIASAARDAILSSEPALQQALIHLALPGQQIQEHLEGPKQISGIPIFA